MSKTNSALAFRLGTRGSALAMWQANWTRSALEQRVNGVRVEIVKIKTTGDRIQDVPLAQVGGKGLFTKELDEALLDGRIDMAVHSLKDLPFELPDRILLAAIGEREDPRDGLVSDGRTLAEMPEGARIGTSSLRRQAQLHARFPSFELMMLRGNVDTRLRKLDDGDFDGIILAVAGLKRLGYGDRITEPLEPAVMLPAIGQGALAFVCRSGDTAATKALASVNHEDSRVAVTSERALMASLEGSCQVPVAGYARVESGQIRLRGLIASLDGTALVSDEVQGASTDAVALGADLGERLRAAGGDRILNEIRHHGN
jgi:hydroxymethylbilane synthase